MCINIGLNIGIETAVIPLNSNILGENVFEKTFFALSLTPYVLNNEYSPSSSYIKFSSDFTKLKPIKLSIFLINLAHPESDSESLSALATCLIIPITAANA